MQAEFEKAAEDIKKLTKRPNDEELLELYALFKQATVGDNNQPKPGMFQLKEKAKHENWLKKKGLSSNDAKKAYIELAKELIARYGA